MRAGVQVLFNCAAGLTATCAYRKLSVRFRRAAKIVGAAKVTGQRPITNVVMMGMGEPLLNLTNVVPAMEIMLDDFGFRLVQTPRHAQRPAWCLPLINWAI